MSDFRSFDSGLDDAFMPNAHLKVAVIEDDPVDAFLMKILVKEIGGWLGVVECFASVDELLAVDAPTFDVIVLDRMLGDGSLSEGRIRELRAACPDAGLVMHTNALTPSLRACAIHEGAFAVMEKGSLEPEDMWLLLQSAAVLGPKLARPLS
ncbi:response regulator [Henriciella marina]|uniref:response regulator n=1 Tax=Henriciella marina TaxID=453851 RepID=UPI0003811BDC|nr:response regulator [Henriciella marina]